MLITFSDEQVRDGVIKEKWLDNWFDRITPWNEESTQMERFAWVGCYEMPLNVWNVPTFKTIGNMWGHFIDVDGRTLSQKSFEKCRILIVTERVTKVEG